MNSLEIAFRDAGRRAVRRAASLMLSFSIQEGKAYFSPDPCFRLDVSQECEAPHEKGKGLPCTANEDSIPQEGAGGDPLRATEESGWEQSGTPLCGLHRAGYQHTRSPQPLRPWRWTNGEKRPILQEGRCPQCCPQQPPKAPASSMQSRGLDTGSRPSWSLPKDGHVLHLPFAVCFGERE
jgi:hypothetical protein